MKGTYDVWLSFLKYVNVAGYHLKLTVRRNCSVIGRITYLVLYAVNQFSRKIEILHESQFVALSNVL